MQMDSMEKQFGRKIEEKDRDVYATIGGTPHLDTQYTVLRLKDT